MRDYRTTITADGVWSELELDQILEDLGDYADVVVERHGDQGIKIAYTVGGNCLAEHHVGAAAALLEELRIECTRLVVSAEPSE